MKRNRRVKALSKVTAVFQTESSGSKSTEDWVVLEFHLKETISYPYQGQVDVVTERSDVDYATMVGKHCALALVRGHKQKRTFTGIIFRVKIISQSAGQSIVRFEMAAAVYALQYGKRSRIFENMSSAEIIVSVILHGLKPFKREIEAHLLKKYPSRECCTQFQESDLDFVLRLMAEEGMFFYFDQSGKTEKLVLVDSNDACPVLTLKKTPAPKVVEPLPPPRLDKIILRVVENESGDPIPGVKIKIKLLSGIVETLTTNSEGITEKQVEPATYRVYSTYAGKHSDQYVEFVGEGELPIATDSEKPSPESQTSPSKSKPNIAQWPSELVICKVEKHQVKSGDTLVSLAGNCRMTPSELAYYNWGTWDQDQIEMFMRTKVGCTKKDEQGKYRFDDSDDPGIIYCPLDWEMENVPRNKMHTLRVRKVNRGFGDLMFFIEIDRLSPESKDANVILEATDRSWQQLVKVTDMPEIEPGTIQLTFSDVPSGKTFNIIQESNKSGARSIHARDLSYGEIRELALAQYETQVRDEEDRQTWDENQNSEPEGPPAPLDDSGQQSKSAELPVENHISEEKSATIEEKPDQGLDHRIPVKIGPISVDNNERIKTFCQSLEKAILQEIELSSIVRPPKMENGEQIEGGRWMINGTSFILSEVIRLNINLLDVESSDPHPVLLEKGTSMNPQTTAKEIVRRIESIVQGK